MINNKESDAFLGRLLIWLLECAQFFDSSLSCAIFHAFSFWDQNNIIKKRKIQPDIACDSMADVLICASRDSFEQNI